jgi:tRNA A37 threonylcarbamoyltransferase TsaD
MNSASYQPPCRRSLVVLLALVVVGVVVGGGLAQSDAAQQSVRDLQQQEQQCIYQRLPTSFDNVAYLDWVGMLHFQEIFRVNFTRLSEVQSSSPSRHITTIAIKYTLVEAVG